MKFIARGHCFRPSVRLATSPTLKMRSALQTYEFHSVRPGLRSAAARAQSRLCEVSPALTEPFDDGSAHSRPGAAILLVRPRRIEDKLPDHSAFSRARNERFRESDIFRLVFERIVSACIAADLVGGKGFAADASLIAADANKCRSTTGAEWSTEIDPEPARRAVKDYLATLDDPVFGAASEVTPKFISPSDPAAQWTGALAGSSPYEALGRLRRWDAVGHTSMQDQQDPRLSRSIGLSAMPGCDRTSMLASQAEALAATANSRRARSKAPLAGRERRGG